MSDLVSVVVPARNEASTIAGVINTLMRMEGVDEIIVVDNGSDDDTGAVASAAGARTVSEPVPGMGNAIKAGIAAARHDWIMKVDADLSKFDTSLFAGMLAARGPGVGLVKGVWNDPADNMPMTRLLVAPAIKALAPGLSWLQAPNSGIYLVDRSLIAHQELTGGYAVDLDVMLRVHAAGAAVVEADIGRITHDSRDVPHYNAMADTIMAFFMGLRDKRLDKEVVVLAQRAEQVIVHALAVVADRARCGAPVSIFLSEFDSVAAGVLKSALAPFPTAAVLPMVQAPAFLPRSAARRLCVIAPFPVAHEDDAIHQALRLSDEADSALAAEILLMPMGPGHGGVVDSFRADTALESPDGARIKDRALAVTGLSGAAHGTREVFQTYASLPKALKSDLSAGEACSSVAGLF